MTGSDPAAHSDGPLPRVILLGASNLTRGISTVVESAQRRLDGPVEIIAALGHGRSYGMDSRVLARGLPGILECGLWDELARRPPAASTYALITDIGNDIMYGAAPEEIATWIDTCLERLREHGAHVTITRLPLGSIDDLGRVRFALARAILYPARGLTLETARRHVRDVDERVCELAARRGVPLAEQERRWYGLDPVHIRLKDWSEAWARFLEAWPAPAAGEPRARGSFGRWVRLRLSMPERYRLFGLARGRKQPATRLADGTTVSLY